MRGRGLAHGRAAFDEVREEVALEVFEVTSDLREETEFGVSECFPNALVDLLDRHAASPARRDICPSAFARFRRAVSQYERFSSTPTNRRPCFNAT